jgi:hypothetical protein
VLLMFPSLVTIEVARQRQADLLDSAGPLTIRRPSLGPVTAAVRGALQVVADGVASVVAATTARPRRAPEACATC